MILLLIKVVFNNVVTKLKNTPVDKIKIADYVRIDISKLKIIPNRLPKVTEHGCYC